MKYVLSLILSLTVVLTFSQRKVKYDELESKNALMYVVGENTPYTGKCFTLYDNGKLGMGGYYVNGQMNGDWIWWYKDGNKKRYAQYKNGIKHGKSIYYYKNGVKKSEIIYDENKNIRQISYNQKGEIIPNPSMSKFKN
jgi:antitoxin component YwqK of YwqJK toxin-antitoxin module